VHRSDPEPGRGPTPLPPLRAAIARTYGVQLFFAASAFVASLLTARLLGPTGRGTLTLLILIPTTLTALFEMGQFFAMSHLAARQPRYRESLSFNTAVYSIATIGPGLGLCALLTSYFLPAVSNLALVSLLGASAIGAGVYLRAESGLAVGIGKLVLYNLSRAVLGGTFPALLVLIATLGMVEVRTAFVAWCVASFASAATLGAGLRPVMGKVSAAVAIEQLKVGLPIHSSNVSQFLLLRADQALLAIFATRAAVGHYSVAVNVSEVVLYAPTSAAAIVLPRLSDARYDASAVDTLADAMRIAVWASIGSAVVLAACGPAIVHFAFGANFDGSIASVELLLPGAAAMGIAAVAVPALIARRRFRSIFVCSAASVVLNLSLNLALIPAAGAAGAALAASIAYIASAIGFVLLCSSEYDTRPSEWLHLPGRATRHVGDQGVRRT